MYRNHAWIRHYHIVHVLFQWLDSSQGLWVVLHLCGFLACIRRHTSGLHTVLLEFAAWLKIVLRCCPTFLGGGMACTNTPPPSPPLFEYKITLNLTVIVKKLTFLTVKLLKPPKIARSLRSLAHKCILRLDLCGFASTVHVFFFWHHLCKERCRIKQTLCNITARKSTAGLPIIQVKGTWRSQGGIILGSRKNNQWLKSEIPHWNIVQSHVVSFALSHLCISNNASEIWYIKCTLYYQYDVNSVNNNSRGNCNRPYRNITFWGMKICVSGALARFARSRVLVNKWVKALYYIEYNQSNINNGSGRPSSSPY